jgi:hypothetical protein
MSRDIARQSTADNRLPTADSQKPKADNRRSTSVIRNLSFCFFYLLSPISYLLSPICASADSSAEARLSLASSLFESGDYARSALEYRRLAADLEPLDKSLPDLYLAAADAYRANGAWDRMEKMLDHAEDAGAAESAPLLLLRTEQAEGARNWVSAADYAEELAVAGKKDERLSRWAQGAAASDYLRAGDAEAARGAVAGDAGREAAIDRYLAGHDKSPRIGGLLGLVPGLGYAYSGEWGNMFRSIFLNGIFGWAMFECADHDQWGLFAVTTFFELTWYSGSVYGGIDAAHRYNRNRLDMTVRELRGDEAPRLERDTRLEVFSLRISF